MSSAHWTGFAVLLVLCTSALSPGDSAFEYPAMVLNAHDADDNCWRGMDIEGNWRGFDVEPGIPVSPDLWLVGPPPSEYSAVTIPESHWVDLAFSGRIIDGDGNDILIVESGRMGEQALVFLTDGADRDYVAALVTAEQMDQQGLSHIEIDLSTNPTPFPARAVRVVGVDLGGGSPGFDLANIRARVSHECMQKACDPNPLSGVTGVGPDIRLNWTPGCSAGGHRIYVSDAESEVISCSPSALHMTLPPDVNTFQPPALRLGRTYYWRVDEVRQTEASDVQPGDVWSFTVEDHLVIDDFESYGVDGGPRLLDVWQVGGWADAWLECADSPVCRRSLAFSYSYAYGGYSDVSRIFNPAQDWTRAGAKVLQLRIDDGPNDVDGGELLIALTDGRNARLVPYPGAADANDSDLHTWRIALSDFNNVDLTQVRGMTVGVHSVSTESDGFYTGSIRIADIGLYPAVCPEDRRPAGDLDADCVVSFGDLQRMAADWLMPRIRTYSVAAPNEPVLWYTFDGHADDSAGSAHGQALGRLNYEPGVHGQAVRFANSGDAVVIPDAPGVFAGIHDAITIAFWQRGDDSSHLNDTLCCSNYEYGKSNPAIGINLGCWENPGQYRWDCGWPWSLDNRVAGGHDTKAEWAGQWNHWVFTKDVHGGPDGKTGRMEIYLNGVLYDRRDGTDSPITNITSFEIGAGWYGRYDGLIDDFQIYDYALSAAEVAYLATNGTGVIEDHAASRADLNADGRVDLRDFAVLATEWLEDHLWP